jgi:SAM-dependent methyltransferase
MFETSHIECPACPLRFPVVDGVPILINEANSVFSILDCARRRPTTSPKRSFIESTIRRVLPELSWNARAAEMYALLASLLDSSTEHSMVLVVGGAELGQGMEHLLKLRNATLIETDVSVTDRTAIVCDAHDLCFAAQTFDAVIVQAVLEEVVDPYRCVEELHRVLRPSGFVYAETPFMQQVHAGRYDFTRFTPLGHRRLFRRFVELRSGSVAGPGVVMAWAYSHLLQGFASRRRGKLIAKAVARLTGFWLKYLDRVLIDRPGSQDGPSCVYFLGQRSEETLTDADLLKMYRGIV